MESKHIEWAQKIKAIAQIGLELPKDEGLGLDTYLRTRAERSESRP